METRHLRTIAQALREGHEPATVADTISRAADQVDRRKRRDERDQELTDSDLFGLVVFGEPTKDPTQERKDLEAHTKEVDRLTAEAIASINGQNWTDTQMTDGERLCIEMTVMFMLARERQPA